MVTNKNKSTGNKTRKNNIKKPGITKALLDLALIIPKKSINGAVYIYVKFMKPFMKAVTKRLKVLMRRPSTRKNAQSTNLTLAINHTIKKPKFKRAWTKTVSQIFDVLITPIIGKSIKLIKKEGVAIAKAIATIVGKITLRSGQAVAGGIEGALSAIPGVGTVLDLLQVAQAGVDTVATLTVQSLKIVTKIMVALMDVIGFSITPLVKTVGLIKPLIGSVLGRRRGETRKKRPSWKRRTRRRK